MKEDLETLEAEFAVEDADYRQRMLVVGELRRRLWGEVGFEPLGELGRVLSLADGPLGLLGQAFESEADGSETLAALRFSVALDDLSSDDELQGRLAAAEGEPWGMVLDAVRAVSDRPGRPPRPAVESAASLPPGRARVVGIGRARSG